MFIDTKCNRRTAISFVFQTPAPVQPHGAKSGRGKGERKIVERDELRTTCRRTAALCERICCRLRGHAFTYTCACARARRCVRRENAREHAYECIPTNDHLFLLRLILHLLFVALFLTVFPCPFSAFPFCLLFFFLSREMTFSS